MMMKKNRLIFYSVFGSLLLLIFFFSLFVEINSHEGKDLDYGFLLGLSRFIWIPLFCSVILIGMLITNIILHVRDNRRNQRLHDAQLKEINELKAKLYDKGISSTSSNPTLAP